MSNNRSFVAGQRWISDTEPDLGLGVVTATDHRTVTLLFGACNEQRMYAKSTAPLTRLILAAGNQVTMQAPGGVAQLVEIVSVSNSIDTLITYEVRLADQSLTRYPETLLPNNLSMNRPLDRLLAGQLDMNNWFYLKRQTLQVLGTAQASGLMGLSSVRAQLIPHQLYIADEVARRFAPRVMLADEVGLGKTIEAGLILQQQLVSGLATRILIVVPEPLLHQWLVEMLRRFNLQFTLLDKDRCQALQDSGESNPFTTAQLVLSPLTLFTTEPALMQAAESAGWDLCVIDEAHHIELGETFSHDPTTQTHHSYATLLRIASASQGLLLLSATPEQLGPENFFCLLKLLDPARFDNFDDFLAEQQRYRAVAIKARELDEQSPELAELLDQQGTGRILFRNTRRVLPGFARRKLREWALVPSSTQDSEDTETADAELSADPRVAWLSDWLKSPDCPGKVLLICTHDAMAIALDKFLKLKAGVRSSVFHRNMSLVERDRAAAYFAGDSGNNETSGKILVCSEIGSEGRNFQFCQHLVLFDLPHNPDLLEQRIGRLDRIGQQHEIQIHVPYLKSTRQEILFRWYHDALAAFEQISPAAYRLWRDNRENLQVWLDCPQHDANGFDNFLRKVKIQRKIILDELENGRDLLIERNSYHAERAHTLVERIREFDSQSNPRKWLLDVLDSFGVFYEESSTSGLHITPSEDMLLPAFPGLSDEGIDATFDRAHALDREDRALLNWQHPMIIGALDLVFGAHQGKAAVSVLSPADSALPGTAVKGTEGLNFNPSVPFTAVPGNAEQLITGPLTLECLFRIKASGPKNLQLSKYLPETGINVMVALDRNEELTELHIDSERIRTQLQTPEKSAALSVLAEQQPLLTKMMDFAGRSAANKCKSITDAAANAMLTAQTNEIKRLLTLRQRNPNIRQEEIDYLKNQTLALHQSLGNAEAELVALHVILVP